MTGKAGQQVQDGSNDKKYYAAMLHLADDELDLYEYRLLGHYKRVCGERDGWTCYEAVRTTAAACRMSADKVIAARRTLAEKGWIAVEERGTGRGRTVIVTICDRWEANIVHCKNIRKTERSPTSPGNVRQVESERSSGRIKEERIKKNDEEEPLPSGEGTLRPSHKAIDADFLDEMIRQFPGIDVQRERLKFDDYRAAHGRRYKDLRAAFRNWLRKTEEFKQERKGSAIRAVRGDVDLDNWELYQAQGASGRRS